MIKSDTAVFIFGYFFFMAANGARRRRKAEYEAVPAADSEHGSVALVHTGNIEARFDNAENNTLLHTM